MAAAAHSADGVRAGDAEILAVLLWGTSLTCWWMVAAGQGAGIVHGSGCGGEGGSLSRAADDVALSLRLFGWPALIAGQLIMIGAMMAPLLHAPLLAVRRAVPDKRYPIAALSFVAGCCLVWLVLGLALAIGATLIAATVGGTGRAAMLVALAWAAWRFSPLGSACRMRCMAGAEPALGMRADAVAAFRAGAANAGWCAGSSWAPMMLPFFSAELHVAAMAACTAWMACERSAPGIAWIASRWRMLATKGAVAAARCPAPRPGWGRGAPRPGTRR